MRGFCGEMLVLRSSLIRAPVMTAAKEIRFGDNLPKNALRKDHAPSVRSIAKDEEITEDISTLENPAILEQLRQSCKRDGRYRTNLQHRNDCRVRTVFNAYAWPAGAVTSHALLGPITDSSQLMLRLFCVSNMLELSKRRRGAGLRTVRSRWRIGDAGRGARRRRLLEQR
jgi:hypothetical protein